MRRSTLAVLTIGAFLMAATGLHAQEAAAEAEAPAAATPADLQVVAGSVLNPGTVDPMPLNFEFTGSGDDLEGAITVPAVEDMRIVMNDLMLTDSRFTFSFNAPGNEELIECDLERQDDDSFAGECFDDAGTVVPMEIGAFEE
jgi:hypothetical protein